MDQGKVMEIMIEAFITMMKLSGPLLLMSVLVGLVISILQAATQIHEQTLTFVPKLIAIGLTLIVLGPWMMEIMNDFAVHIFEVIATYA